MVDLAVLAMLHILRFGQSNRVLKHASKLAAMVRTMRAFLSAESLNETPDHTRTAFVSKRFERRRAALRVV